MVFVVATTNKTPKVTVEKFTNKQGKENIIFGLHVVARMLFIDLQHELDHIEQICNRFLAKRLILLTSAWQQTASGEWMADEQDSNLLKGWQNAIMEYHVRLLELQRLVKNGADRQTIDYHAKQVVRWSQIYWQKGRGLGFSNRKAMWQQQFFPDLDELRQEVNQIFIDLQLYYPPSEVKVSYKTR